MISFQKLFINEQLKINKSHEKRVEFPQAYSFFYQYKVGTQNQFDNA